MPGNINFYLINDTLSIGVLRILLSCSPISHSLKTPRETICVVCDSSTHTLCTVSDCSMHIVIIDFFYPDSLKSGEATIHLYPIVLLILVIIFYIMS